MKKTAPPEGGATDCQINLVEFAPAGANKMLFDKLNRAALPKKSGAAAYFSMNRTPRVPGPQ